MLDVQIVSGRDPAFAVEAIRRIREQDESVARILLAVNHGEAIEADADELVRNEIPLSFEQNHNHLAKLGDSPYILFLDDDAFLFEGAIDGLLGIISANKSFAAVGAANNQVAGATYQGRALPSSASFEEFLALEPKAKAVSKGMFQRFETQAGPKIFLPGCCLLVRRKAWEREYGGWDEEYRNWNEEVDFNLWCNERGYQTLYSPGTWIFHCHGRSRSPEMLLDNIVHSARHFRDKWPKERLNRLAIQRPHLQAEIKALFELNERNSDPDVVRSWEYFRRMTGTAET